MSPRRRAILPTPVVGMMGLLERADASVGHGFVAEGDLVVLAGDDGVLDASEAVGGALGRPPDVDVDREVATIEFVLAAAGEGILRSAHDVSGGGLAVALAESAIAGGLGAEVALAPGRRDDEVLFGEGGGRVLLTVRPEDEGRLRALAAGAPVRLATVGAVGGQDVAARVGDRRGAPAPGRGPRGPRARPAGGAGVIAPRARGAPDDRRPPEGGVRRLRRRRAGRDVSRLAFYALHALQHRGQESAGIAVSDAGHVTVQRDLGLVSAVFDEPSLRSLTGGAAIGHVRYSTTGANKWDNAQPVTHTRRRHRRARPQRQPHQHRRAARPRCSARGSTCARAPTRRSSPPCSRPESGSLLAAACEVMPRLVGAYSVVAMSGRELIAFRDPHGVRPLVIGRLDDDGWCVASETCALDQIGAAFVRDVRPGEAVRLSAERVESRQAMPSEGARLCVFEHIYFARPDSLMDGLTVWQARRAMGAELASEAPAEADLVVGLPDSGTPAAIGYAGESGIPYAEAVVRNRYVGRSFIQPDQTMRQQGIRLKFNPLPAVIAGKRLVVVDDSIVRGNTTRQIVAMLLDAGAAEVHTRISSPPILWPCYYGIDMADRAELVAAGRTVEEIAALTGSATLAYLCLEGLQRALGRPAEATAAPASPASTRSPSPTRP